MRRKQSVRGGVWHLGGKRRRRKRGQRGRGVGGRLPIAALMGSVAAPLVGEIAKPILKKIVGGKRRTDDERKNIAKTTCNSRKSSITKRKIFLGKVRESEQTKFTAKCYNKTNKTN